MNITTNYNTTNFKELNYAKVRGKGLNIVNKELPKLKELAEEYYIKLASENDGLCDYDYIEIFVSPINKKLGPLNSIVKAYNYLFSDRGRWCYFLNEDESILDAVKRAMSTLK